MLFTFFLYHEGGVLLRGGGQEGGAGEIQRQNKCRCQNELLDSSQIDPKRGGVGVFVCFFGWRILSPELLKYCRFFPPGIGILPMFVYWTYHEYQREREVKMLHVLPSNLQKSGATSPSQAKYASARSRCPWERKKKVLQKSLSKTN